MMDNFFSLLVDGMMWGTVPLTFFLGYWERRLALSDTSHQLAEIFLVGLLFAWVYFWYCIGEYQSITHYLPPSDEPQPVRPVLSDGCLSQSGRAESVAVMVKEEVAHERKQHVSAH